MGHNYGLCPLTTNLTCRAAVQSSLLPRNTCASLRNLQFGAAQPGQVQRLVTRRSGQVGKGRSGTPAFPHPKQASLAGPLLICYEETHLVNPEIRSQAAVGGCFKGNAYGLPRICSQVEELVVPRISFGAPVAESL